VKHFVIFILLGCLSACTGLDRQSFQLDIGSTKEEVLKILGNPLNQSTKNGVLAWQYGDKIALGYCDYKDYYFLNNQVIYINQYVHSSLAGCKVGLQKIDWDPILAKADALSKEHSQAPQHTTSP
jgi:hypothetical protein